MARTAPRARPDREQVLETVHAHCPACGRRLRYRYDNRHTVTTLGGLVRLRLRIRRCEDPGCARYRRPSSTGEDLAVLLREVAARVGVPIAGVVSDGQHSVRRAVRLALPGVPQQLCQFHYLREAALPIFEADRHAKKELKKRVRGVRPIERSVEGRDDPEAEAVRGYCAAVRSAITDDGRPPLAAPGLKLAGRLEAVAASLGRAATKGG